ncbi:MAG: hypothetical protein ACLGIM_16120 [Alphaproteobacteria bacterium]
MTITIGWWAIPAIITIATIIFALWPSRSDFYGSDITGAFQLMACIIVSLVAWVIWSLLA